VAGWGSVFVSHTSDMADYPPDRSFVQAATEAVSRVGMRPVDMAQFAAREEPPAAYCQQQVRTCDVYLAVVGFRYGSRVPDRSDGVSYTELEFLTATEAGLPRLVFVLDESAPVPRSMVDRDSTAVDGFRERLHRAGVTVATVATPAELGEAVLHALYELQRRSHRLRSDRRGGDGVADPGHLEAVTRSGVVQPTHPHLQTRPWMAPPLDRMVERPELGDRLMAALLAPGRVELGLTTALEGAGGFGKTTLATWVCHRIEIDQRFPGGLLWVTVGQEVRGADLAERVNDLAFVLAGRRPAISDPDAAGAELGRLLDEREPMLLVVDDVWESAQLRPFRFGGRACTRLVTTRIPDLLPPGGPRIAVDVMSAEQARKLVADGVGGLPAGAVDQLATVAGRWPVLLNLVNGVLRRQVARGQRPEAAAGEILRLLAVHGPAALDPARPAERARAVAATVEASLTLMAPADRERYLELAIFPEDVDIPLTVLALLWPDCRVDALCENVTGLGLVADYRLDPPGPRLVLHDVIRAYLRQRVVDQAAVHARLVDAAAGLLPAHAEAVRPPWWCLPDDSGYLWRFLPHHLHETGRADDLADLVCDLRWVEAKTRRLGSAVGVEADLAQSDAPLATTLTDQLRHSAHLLGPIEPPEALGATLASRMQGRPELSEVLERYRATLPTPRLEPAWPPPDLPDPAQPSRPAAGHVGGVYSCAFSPDGSTLATASDDGTVRLWNVADATVRAVLNGHTGAVWACVFSPDGALLATASDDRSVRLWDVADRTARSVLAHPDPVTCCAFSPDGELLAATSLDGSVRLWGVADSTEHRAAAGHKGAAWSCAFSPNGQLLATAGSDGATRLWNTRDGTEAAVLAGHTGVVRGCAFSPDGTTLATAGGDQTARLWNISDGTETAVLTGHTSRLWSCVFSPDGRLLATSGHDGTCRLWDLADGTERAVLSRHRAAVRGCAFSPDGSLLATTSHDQTARVWNVAEASERAMLTGLTSRVNRCAFLPDGSALVTTSMYGGVLVERVADRAPVLAFTGDTEGIRGCAVSPDGSQLATAGNDGAARLWALASGHQRAALTGHTSWVRSCAYSPDGALLATASNDWTARTWNVADGTEQATLAGHTDVVNCCAFSPDGALLATSSSDATVRIWSVADGTGRAVLTGHTDAATGCAFSPDGALLATTSDDRTARLWDVETGETLHVLTGHTNWAECCAFSPDGTVLATAGSDGVIRIWDTADGRCRCALRVTGPLVGIAWHPTGTVLCAVGGAGTHLLTYRT